MEAIQLARPRKIYYGWYIVALAFLAQFATTGAQGFSAGVFMKPMAEDLGWSRGGIAGVNSVGTLIGGIIGLFIGNILDRHGARPLMIFGAIVTGIGFIALSTMQELWHFYLIRGIIITIGTTCSGMVVANIAVSNWFVRKRGRAVAVAVMGVPTAGVVLGPAMQMIIDSFSWRTGWIALGLMIWVLLILPTALFMKRRPEDIGLVPDGALPTQEDDRRLSGAQKAAIAADVKWTRREAIRTPTLWMIIIAAGLGTMTLPTTMMHLVPFVSDLGYSLQVATLTAGVHSLFSMLSKLIWGFGIERIHARYVVVLAYSFAAAGLILLLLAHSIESIIVGMAVLGIGVGGVIPITEVIWASYFGRISLGSIRTIGMPFSIITQAGGPFMAGVIYDNTKSYQAAFIFLIITLVIGASLMLALRPAKRPQTSAAKATA